MTPTEIKVVLALLYTRFRDKTSVEVSVRRLSELAKVHPNLVSKATNGLEGMGLIKKHRSTSGGRTRYHILPYGEELPPHSVNTILERQHRFSKRKCDRPRNSEGCFTRQERQAGVCVKPMSQAVTMNRGGTNPIHHGDCLEASSRSLPTAEERAERNQEDGRKTAVRVRRRLDLSECADFRESSADSGIDVVTSQR